MRWARRLSGRFEELERLRAGVKGQRRVTWLTGRLALVRSSQGIVAIAVAPVWQIAAFSLGAASVAALVAGLIVAGVFERSGERQAQEIIALRSVVRSLAEQATQAEQERAASLQRAAAERKAMAAETVTEQSRLAAERDAALERASALEQANADRARLEQERDRARTERDELANEVDVALRELDGETRRILGDVEKIFAATGIDPRLARPPMRRTEARGGPYVPWQGFVSAGRESANRFEGVARRLERLKPLRDALQQLPIIMPVTGAVLSGGFGFRFDPFNGASARHEGVDLRATFDSTVYAPGAGTVISAGWNGEFGNMVEVDHGFGVVTRYAHLSRINVRVGDLLMPRQPIGVIGATGRATGAHLHYEIRVAGQAIDPLKFLHAADVR
ncbi:MAG TPA: peptidoglycan DD-metalloendopeptidase family protein [Reyranella sp.]|nr:peptidoglycan DD-metalloendopeptidase family protein [Reyranella sp.]